MPLYHHLLPSITYDFPLKYHHIHHHDPPCVFSYSISPFYRRHHMVRSVSWPEIPRTRKHRDASGAIPTTVGAGLRVHPGGFWMATWRIIPQINRLVSATGVSSATYKYRISLRLETYDHQDYYVGWSSKYSVCVCLYISLVMKYEIPW